MNKRGGLAHGASPYECDGVRRGDYHNLSEPGVKEAYFWRQKGAPERWWTEVLLYPHPS